MRTAAAALALAAGCAAPSRALAFTQYPSHWDPGALPVPYRVNVASAPPSVGADGGLAAVQAAFGAWAAPGCTSWRAQYAGASTQSYVATLDGENTVLWITGPAGSWPPELGDELSTLAATTPVWQGQGPFVEADLRFNAVAFTWSLDGATNTVDQQSVATHEAGHFLGLGHSSDPAAVMSPTYSGGLRRALGSDDVAGVCALYPSGDGGAVCGDGGEGGCADAAGGSDGGGDGGGEGGGGGCRCGAAPGAGELRGGLAAAAMVMLAAVLRRRRRAAQLL